MRYIDEFRNKRLISRLTDKIRQIMPNRKINIMEVCGTHTQAFFRFGLDKILPSKLRLISGPGCPVCVSPQGYIDSAIELAKEKDVIILTFGDMLRIPGTHSTLEKERAELGNVGVVYSGLDCLKAAKLNPGKKIIFLAVGFETTAPTIALTVITAKKENLKNLFFLSSLKLIPPAMAYLLKDKRLKLDAFLCPGHVSAIIGTKPYEFIPQRYNIGCCVTGFEPLDILEGIHALIKQIVQGRPQVANQYIRVVTKEGNFKAQKLINRVFKISIAFWRGLGKIPKSGLMLRDEFCRFDAERIFNIRRTTNHKAQTTRCRCGDVLKGLIYPKDCVLFARVCSPDNPIGPCMVSNEGACNAYYKYRK
jgi:hydrogenase expression/formation protein HypD